MEKFVYSDLHKSILHQLAMMKIGNSHSMESDTKWKILAVSTKSSNYKYNRNCFNSFEIPYINNPLIHF